MRRIAASIGLVALGLAAGPGRAQAPAAPNLPDAIPFGQPYGTPVTLAQARTILAGALAEAEKRGWPLNIAVVDSHGELVHFARMDGAQFASVDIARRKARTAARWRRETRVFFEAYGKGPPVYATLDPELAATSGGIPIVVDGTIIGAVGCSGGTSDQDVVVCRAGLDALK